MKDRTQAIVDGGISILWIINAARATEPWMVGTFSFLAAVWGFFSGMYLARHLLERQFESRAEMAEANRRLIERMTDMVAARRREHLSVDAAALVEKEAAK